VNALIVAVAGTYATDPQYAHLVAAMANQTNVAEAISRASELAANTLVPPHA
jgi:flagellum-specific peptidoglycan hydrolase FlgJ